ncbi:MAG TPA: S8 family serine peptidase [Thermodesulfobacteriota bacterium]|nr:S8 family serine peptidase [Thermodesulfobacteriota bacterium]
MRRTERVKKGYLISILILFFFSFISWTAVHSEEAPFIKGEKEGHPKLESALFDLQREHLLHGKEISSSFAQSHDLRMDEQEKVTVFILPKAGETKEAIDIETLKAYGGEVLKSGHSVIKAKVPILLLDHIADYVEGINFIKRPDRPYAEIVSEGVGLTGASFFQASGYSGQNVKVAIIDLGFAQLSEAISAGVLPVSVIKIDCSGTDCTPTDFSSEKEKHGTAVAEVVYDMAPGAQLYLIKVDDSLDLIDAKDYCIANGIRIINHSVGWFISNFYDGACYFDNPVCTANHAYKSGILWVNAVGNEARSHYGATFIDRDGDRLHNVTEDNNFISLHASAGDRVIALLTWDAWPATDHDYDLLLFDSSKNLVASSTTPQTGTQPPQEGIIYVAPASGTYYLAVRNGSSTTNFRFSIFSLNHDLSPFVATSSLVSPADATGVMAVAAINYTRWLTGPQESFSSQGPTMDGRIKPEISGPDGNSSFIYGSFVGTSASSPHVAGAAALILSNDSTFSVSQLWDVLTASAIDLGGNGQDSIFGYGRLNLATISVDPLSIDFGEVIVGNFLERNITIQNVGNPSLTIGGISAPSSPYMLTTDQCSGRSLPLGGTCTLTVRISPLSPGSFNSTLTIPSTDPFKSVVAVSLKGKGTFFIDLQSPEDQLSADACSANGSPFFQWEVLNPFTRYEIQFSMSPTFSTIPMKIKKSGTPAYAMPSSQWKRVLLIPGDGGGTIYWRVVGTTSNGSQSTSNRRSIRVGTPLPVGNPAISPVSQGALPLLTWQNRCNVRFKVWFGSDAGFSRKAAFFLRLSDSTLSDGTFSKELTPAQWLGIRRLVGDNAGSKIYWYIESWDGLNRNSATAAMSFILQD